MKIVEYMILSDIKRDGEDLRTDDGELASAVLVSTIVDDAISDGWQPFGPPIGGKNWLAQAMVKYDAND